MKVKLTPLFRTALAAGLHLLARAQENAAKSEENAGNADFAKGCRELVAKIEAEQQRIQVAPDTVLGLMETGIAAALGEKADDVESNFLPAFQDQASLPLGKKEPIDFKSRAAGERADEDEQEEFEPLAAVAAREAEAAENGREPKKRRRLHHHPAKPKR